MERDNLVKSLRATARACGDHVNTIIQLGSELAEFKQEVSDAISADVDKQISAKVLPQFRTNSVRFVIPTAEPDKLVEVLCGRLWSVAGKAMSINDLSAALEARGLKIMKVKNDD